jgi:hypothetical protein
MPSSVSGSLHGKLMQALREYGSPLQSRCNVADIFDKNGFMSLHVCSSAQNYSYSYRLCIAMRDMVELVLLVARNGVHRCAGHPRLRYLSVSGGLGRKRIPRCTSFRLGQILPAMHILYTDSILCSL